MEYRNEKITIDGRKRDCKILFSCKHVDDTAAYDMMCEGIEITPENAPVSDFELMLIEDTYSPFGFSFVCKRNNKEDVWEHSGFGNSGACSIVTALLKQLTCKTQECEELKKANQHIDTNRQCKGSKLKRIEELISACETGYTDEFIQKIRGIIQKPEPTINYYSIIDRYRKALEEIENFTKKHCDFYCEHNRILDIINKAKDTTNE